MPKKQLLETCQRLRIGDVKSAIPNAAVSAVIEIGTQEIVVVGKLTNLGNGYRYYFQCPQCQRAVENVYAADFSNWKCRICVGGVYASTRKIRVESEHNEYEYRPNS